MGDTNSVNIGVNKKPSYEELEKLTYIPGGRNLMANFLQLEP